MYYESKGLGHDMVGVGYASAGGHPNLVVINDPQGGGQYVVTYEEAQRRGNFVKGPHRLPGDRERDQKLTKINFAGPLSANTNIHYVK